MSNITTGDDFTETLEMVYREAIAPQEAEELADAKRARRRFWKAYRKARRRLLAAIISEPGAISNTHDRLGALTLNEYGIVLDRRTREVQNAWADYESAERWVAGIEPDAKFRRP